MAVQTSRRVLYTTICVRYNERAFGESTRDICVIISKITIINNNNMYIIIYIRIYVSVGRTRGGSSAARNRTVMHDARCGWPHAYERDVAGKSIVCITPRGVEDRVLGDEKTKKKPSRAGEIIKCKSMVNEWPWNIYTLRANGFQNNPRDLIFTLYV